MSPYTVSRELGHGSEEMVRRVYSHLGTVRHRSEVVEYRVEQFERRGDSGLRDTFSRGASLWAVERDFSTWRPVGPILPVSFLLV